MRPGLGLQAPVSPPPPPLSCPRNRRRFLRNQRCRFVRSHSDAICVCRNWIRIFECHSLYSYFWWLWCAVTTPLALVVHLSIARLINKQQQRQQQQQHHSIAASNNCIFAVCLCRCARTVLLTTPVDPSLVVTLSQISFEFLGEFAKMNWFRAKRLIRYAPVE